MWDPVSQFPVPELLSLDHDPDSDQSKGSNTGNNLPESHMWPTSAGLTGYALLTKKA